MKTPVPIFSGNVNDKGKLIMLEHVRSAMRRWYLTLRGQKVDVVIRKYVKKRTNQQNRYYFGVVLPILSLHFGHDNPEDMHEDLKLEFNPIESKVTPGKMIGGSTTKMTTKEFFSGEESYVNRICRWAAMEHSLYVPPPEKVEEG